MGTCTSRATRRNTLRISPSLHVPIEDTTISPDIASQTIASLSAIHAQTTVHQRISSCHSSIIGGDNDIKGQPTTKVDIPRRRAFLTLHTSDLEIKRRYNPLSPHPQRPHQSVSNGSSSTSTSLVIESNVPTLGHVVTEPVFSALVELYINPKDHTHHPMIRELYRCYNEFQADASSETSDIDQLVDFIETRARARRDDASVLPQSVVTRMLSDVKESEEDDEILIG